MSSSPVQYGKSETLFASYPPTHGVHLHPHGGPLHPHHPALSTHDLLNHPARMLESPHRLNGFNHHHTIDGILGTSGARRPGTLKGKTRVWILTVPVVWSVMLSGHNGTTHEFDCELYNV